MDLRSALSPALAPLWREVHRRLSSGRPVTRVRVGPLEGEQRGALADLLGLSRLPGEYATVSLPQLDDVLQAAVGVETRQVVAELVGPVGDQASDRIRAAAERADLWAWVESHPVVVAQPVLTDWVAFARRTGLVGGSVARTRAELDRALRVLAELPATGVPLPVLADQILDDPHALDDGTRCATLVQRALAVIYQVPAAADAHDRRALWERAGVTNDDLSSLVFAAGLRTSGGDVTSRILRVCADAGEAAALTLRQLRSAGWTHGVPRDVWVFENPSVLSLALTRFGAGCPPIVCVSGWPSGAGILLLRALAAAGSRLWYHGDLDGEGIRIAANVLSRTGATPWRMSTADYLAAAIRDGPPAGRVTEAPWDPDLAGALRQMGAAVVEERVAGQLLDELAARHAS
ncbi:MAG: TIGR02679 family protein [Stackebrandtia sp.]